MASPLYDGVSQKLSDEFKSQYGDKRSAIKEHVMTVKEILEDGIKSGAFRAIPITTRMKELDSALGSLQKKQKVRFEREDLQSRMENQGRDWVKYWTERTEQEQIWIRESPTDITGMKERRIEDQTNNLGDFKDCDNMINALQDLGGARVCVYFPHDVDKVIYFLNSRNDLKILLVTRKTQRKTDMDELRSHVGILEGKLPTVNQGPGTFAGYRAAHAIIELVGDAIPGSHKGRPYKVEVQISTAVMHAWSEVEHDIVYKTS